MKKNYWTDLLWLTALLAIAFSVLLGVRPLNTPDEGRYAEIAHEMLVYHNYITPQLNHLVFFDKPPLVYWLMAASMKVFGVTMWAVRIIPALLALLGCLMVYVTARTLYNRQAGWLAAAILASSVLYFALAHYINMDMAVAVLVSIALQGFLLAVNKPQYRRRFLYIAYAACGLAILTKGLIGLVFPLMIIGLWILICRQWKIIKTLCLPTGLLLVALIACPWFILVQKANPEFFHYFFIFEQFTRFTGQQFNNPQPFWFYVPVIILGFYPWMTAAIYSFIKFKPLNTNQIFLLIWIISILFFFSIPAAKISSYILPIFSGLALLTAGFLTREWHNKIVWRWISIINFMLNTAMAVVLIYLANKMLNGLNFFEAQYSIYLSAVILFFGSIAVLVFRKPLWRFLVIVLTAFVFYWLVLAIVPNIVKDSIKPLTDELLLIKKPNDQIVTYNNVYQDLPFYLQQQPITIVANWNAPDLASQDDSLGQMAWSKQYAPHSSRWLITQKDFWQLWHSNERVFVFVDRDSLANFQDTARTPIYIIDNVKYTYLLSNKNY